MHNYNTKYGILQHIGEHTCYPDDSIKECMLTEKEVIHTEYGDLIPQYEYAEERRKYIYSISFYEDGSLRRIALNEKTEIETPIGRMSAELITFYKNGKIKRLFPLNGRISAYWDENEEYSLAKNETLSLSCGTVEAKLISIGFYEEGSIKNLTMWPNELVKMNTPIGEIKVRIGIALYPDGTLKSIEPAYPVLLQTPIGRMNAYDSTASGISGDMNSLVFSKNSTVEQLMSCDRKVKVLDKNNKFIKIYTPVQELDEDGIEISFTPLKVTFTENSVCFNDSDEYQLSNYIFFIESYIKSAPDMCSDCSSCGRCG